MKVFSLSLLFFALSLQAAAFNTTVNRSEDSESDVDIRMAHSELQSNESDFSPIFDVSGTQVLCRAQSISTFRSLIWINSNEIEWGAKNVVIDGKDIYIQNILSSSYLPGSYIKGELNNDIVTFSFPQDFCETTSEGATKQYYINRVVKSGGQYIVDPDCQTVTFEYNDGVLTQKDGVIGVCEEDGKWAGFCDENIVLTPFEEKIQSMPEDVKAESYAFLANTMGHFVNIAIDNDAYYIKGLFENAPESVIKGTLSNGKVIIDTPQYIGAAEGYLLFAIPGKKSENAIEIKESISFTIDTETKSFAPEDSLDIILINAGPEDIAYLTYYIYMQFVPQSVPEKAIPATPNNECYYNWYEQYGEDIPYDMFQFSISPFSTENLLLPYDRLYYEVLFNNEVYEFEPDTYQNIDKPISLIPYLFDDKHDIIYANYGEHHIYIYDFTLENIGVKAYYKNEDGSLSASETVSLQIRNPSGISEDNCQLVVISEKWFTLDGYEVENPEPGTYVKWIKYGDGSAKAFKVKIVH